MTAPAAPVIQHILDVEEGLERLMGDQKLYRQLLRRFRQDYQLVAAQVRQAMAQGDHEEARRRLHSLKGASGMIGAQELHHLAHAAETCFRSAGLELQAGLDLVEASLAGLLRVLDAYLQDTVDPTVTASPATLPPMAPETRALLARLAILLDEGNGEAIDLLEQSATALASSLGLDRFQEVASLAHQFDFEGALTALRPAL